MPEDSASNLFAELTVLLGALPASSTDQVFIRRYLGTSRQVLGVRTEDLRAQARATAKAHAGWSDAQWLALLDALYAGVLFEQRSLAGLLLGRLNSLRRRLDLARLQGWLAQQIGWAEVDATCQSSWSDQEVLARWDEWDPFLNGLSQADTLSLRRASLVLLITPLRHNADPRLTHRALANVQRLQGERDRMITKALSWVLRTMIAEQPDAVRRYLAGNAGELPSAVVREVRKKLETGRKNG
ncbi:MAG: DNA alkylation repair protein [Caldilinea sp.]|jgi:3-methyladenine DNA glycosylase AlkD